MKTHKEKLIDILSIPIHPRIGADYTEVVAGYLLDNDVVPIVRCKDCKHCCTVCGAKMESKEEK